MLRQSYHGVVQQTKPSCVLCLKHFQKKLIDFFGSKMRQNKELKRFGISTKNRNALGRMQGSCVVHFLNTRGLGLRPL
jgi:hypothetical protein